MKEISRDKHGWFGALMSYAGWGIGLAGLLLTVYVEFIKKDAPKLEYDIVSATDFINNKETSASLRIFVDTLDIQDNHLNITAYNIKVENKGSAHIRYYDYDKGNFGLRIQNGILLEPPVIINASTQHIRELFPKYERVVSESFVDIPTLSLDIDDFYTIRVVLLHNVDSIPSFNTVGKIVGQNNINFHTLQPPVPSFWKTVFYGSWDIHLLRFFIYLLAFTIAVILSSQTVAGISESLAKRKRRRRMNELSKKKELVSFVKDDYVKNGEYAIINMHELFSKTEADITNKYKKSKGFVNSKRALESNNKNAIHFHRDRYQRIVKLINLGYFEIKEDDKIVFNKAAKRTVQAIYTMLQTKDLIKVHRENLTFYDGLPSVEDLVERHAESDVS